MSETVQVRVTAHAVTRSQLAERIRLRARQLLLETLRRISLDPSLITEIAAAALVLLQLECGRTI